MILLVEDCVITARGATMLKGENYKSWMKLTWEFKYLSLLSVFVILASNNEQQEGNLLRFALCPEQKTRLINHP